jgi:hypothetical protein
MNNPFKTGDVIERNGNQRKVLFAGGDAVMTSCDNSFDTFYGSFHYKKIINDDWKKVEPKIEGRLNVYPNGENYFHRSKEEADRYANPDRRIKCVKVREV